MWFGMVCEAHTLHPHMISIQSSDFWFVVLFVFIFFPPRQFALHLNFVLPSIGQHFSYSSFALDAFSRITMRWKAWLELICHSFQRHLKWNAKTDDTIDCISLSRRREHFFFSRIWKLDCNGFCEIQFFFNYLYFNVFRNCF